eukprot:scaffold22769_cov14-Tisochrysis_lutea.AAC.1
MRAPFRETAAGDRPCASRSESARGGERSIPVAAAPTGRTGGDGRAPERSGAAGGGERAVAEGSASGERMGASGPAGAAAGGALRAVCTAGGTSGPAGAAAVGSPSAERRGAGGRADGGPSHGEGEACAWCSLSCSGADSRDVTRRALCECSRARAG